jgi:hypothetical protein
MTRSQKPLSIYLLSLLGLSGLPAGALLGTLLAAAPVLVAQLVAGPANAAPMLFSESLSFATGNQSLWGPGGSNASFGNSGSASVFVPPFGPTVGAGYSAGASSGTARADLSGTLRAGYESEVLRGTTPITVDFLGSSASFGTDLGARFDVTGFVHDIPFFGPWDFCLYCANWQLDPSRSFTPVFGQTVTASDSFGVAGVGPDIGVASAQLTLNANQTASFRPTALAGTLAYVHRESGRARAIPFSLSGVSVLDALLDEAGTWDFTFLGLDIRNVFSSVIGANLAIEVSAVGASWDFPFANVSLLNTPSFELNFASLSPLSAFSITVPEPSTLFLMSAGLGGLLLGGRRRERA